MLGFGTDKFVRERRIRDDDQKFDQYGIDRLSAESLPYYARLVRQDLIGVFLMLRKVVMYTQVSLVLLAIIAAALAKIAWGWPSP